MIVCAIFHEFASTHGAGREDLDGLVADFTFTFDNLDSSAFVAASSSSSSAAAAAASPAVFARRPAAISTAFVALRSLASITALGGGVAVAQVRWSLRSA